MLSSCLGGLVKITGFGRLPDDMEVEAKTDIAFMEADRDANGRISKPEFRAFVLRMVRSAKEEVVPGQDGHDVTIEEVLRSFGLLEAEDNNDDGDHPAAEVKAGSQPNAIVQPNAVAQDIRGQ